MNVSHLIYNTETYAGGPGGTLAPRAETGAVNYKIDFYHKPFIDNTQDSNGTDKFCGLRYEQRSRCRKPSDELPTCMIYGVLLCTPKMFLVSECSTECNGVSLFLF